MRNQDASYEGSPTRSNVYPTPTDNSDTSITELFVIIDQYGTSTEARNFVKALLATQDTASRVSEDGYWNNWLEKSRGSGIGQADLANRIATLTTKQKETL